MAEPGALNYRSAGVDLDAAERLVEGLKLLVDSTRDEYTLSALGQFGGLYAVPGDVVSPYSSRARIVWEPRSRWLSWRGGMTPWARIW